VNFQQRVDAGLISEKSFADEFSREVAAWYAERPEGVGVAEWLGITYERYLEIVRSEFGVPA
jgi:hypothetical protein